MKLSVIVCTRNRARQLAAMLERFFEQKFSGDYECELLIVDNASSRETKQTYDKFLNRRSELSDRLHYIRENQPGLSRARNAGLKAVNGEIIVFTDDDVLVMENWLDEIHREFAGDPNLFVLGGRVLLARDGLQDVAVYADEERREYRFPNGGGVAMGANMAFRREVFDRIGKFDVRLGAGTFFAGGEDIEFFYRAMKAGYKMVYAPNVLVHHDHDRTTSGQACRLIYGYGKAYPAYIIKHALRGDIYAMRMIYWLLRMLPSRWRKLDNDTPVSLERRRAQIRGILVGLLTSPFLMLFRKGKTK
ncbi:MAG: glycosyltransferase family 2 protein [Blastocatellales bacterium]